jgi:hypothetical protein
MSAPEEPVQPVKEEGRVIRALKAGAMLALFGLILIWSGVLPIFGIIYLWDRFSP